jgi:arginase
VEKIVSAQQIPFVIGGDCTITIGVVAGFIRKQANLALVYMDGGLDAVTPAAYRLARLDSTGMAHLLAEPGSQPHLSEIGSRYPLPDTCNAGGFIHPEFDDSKEVVGLIVREKSES